MSSLDNYNKYAVKFDFDKEITYNDNYRIIASMAKKTCELKKEECERREKCILNIMELIKCKKFK